MFEGIDFTGWPWWAVATILLAINVFKQPLSNLSPQLFGFLTKRSNRLLNDELAASEYQRERAARREDKSFEMLEVTLEHLRDGNEQDREESRAHREQLRLLTEHISKMTHAIGRNTDILRILSQNTAKVDDRLSDLETQRLGSRADE